MKDYIVKHEWKIIEDSYDVHTNQITESLLSLGNGYMGQRANYEETYTGETLQGTYVAGVYYPDKTKVGWWKNGYPEYFAKVLNSCNWIALQVMIDGEELDIHTCKVLDWYRELDMRAGYLHRVMTVELPSGKQIKVDSLRINSMHEKELGAYQYSITPLNFSGSIQLRSKLDFDISNADSNYDEKFWLEKEVNASTDGCYVVCETKKTGFVVAVAEKTNLYLNGEKLSPAVSYSTATKCSIADTTLSVEQGQTLTFVKHAVISSSLNVSESDLVSFVTGRAKTAADRGFDQNLDLHKQAWAKIWDVCDIVIDGDVSAQQGIRFNIFQLYQTYTGEDARLNIGPKGFTGEKYGGSTYWDTEAYCLPFYLGTADASIARNLLVYRHNHLPKAIENAEKLGFTGGAALYPMVTMNGEECHNEWEITFEEIHRNGAIAYAIYDYIRYTDDNSYLAEYGMEVLVGIARFWAQRVNWSDDKSLYVMLGVTGPNEYENNVNNNWYTNYIAVWCLKYAMESISYVKQHASDRYATLHTMLHITDDELQKWQHIINHMYYPTDDRQGIFLQQDGYLDKEQIMVDDLPASDRPLNQKWSWDRILRSCFIKQADVLQGLYFFEDDFDEDTHRRNFLYYEPRTVHESSLSPCVHSVLAAKLKMDDKAYEMYLRTSRLDLDDYNNDTEDGCHITSMAGTWIAIVKGFAGQRVKEGKLHISPRIPKQWQSLSFKLNFKNVTYHIDIKGDTVTVANLTNSDGQIYVDDQLTTVSAGQTSTFQTIA